MSTESIKLSAKTEKVYREISQVETKLGDLRKIAKAIKRDHEMALELWATGEMNARLLAILIMDARLLTESLLDQLDKDMQQLDYDDKLLLADWLLANQLSKNKKTVALIESWEHAESPLKRRLYWYHQARLRWMGKTDQTNTEELLTSIETNLLNVAPEVQWAMNYTAGQIGKWQVKYRDRCIAIGENTGLYRDEVVAKGCTPSYLPKFIPIEVAKIK